MRNVIIIFKKQLKDTLKNKTVLIQFLLFPVMTLIMENTIRIDGMPELFFTKMFAFMYIGMAPLTATAAIISEEKEKNTLRVLTMANVRPRQYLLGIGAYVWFICMTGAGLMATGFHGMEIAVFLTVMGIGFTLSILAGACIGIYAKNQMVANSVFIPVMMVLSFAPMVALFNERIGKAARYLYTQQLRTVLDRMSFAGMKTEGICILSANALIVTLLFFTLFKRKGLE
ncbi:MAG: ABC transporter permease [Lachnospiraceae bacterium]|nr:ABC transporter permease [Lachnospiraceae bacterium]